MKELLEQAKAAKPQVAALGTEEKNRGLLAMADSLEAHAGEILKANAEDLTEAQGKISDVMLDRLRLTEGRIQAMAQGIRQVAALPDPVGLILDSHTRPDGLKIDKVSVPMGVIAIIYESRPNVTSDAAALTLKSGNVCVLRGGKEAIRSATAIVDALRAGLRQAGIPENAVNLVQDTSRDSATALMTANGYVDLLIPRGGAGLISACVRTATVPCIATGTGICHVYVEKTADQDMALNIIENAKTSRPSVCNAEEVLLVDRAIAPEFLPKLYARIGAKVSFGWTRKRPSTSPEPLPESGTLTRNFWTTFWRSSAWKTSGRRFLTSPPTPPATARPLSPKTARRNGILPPMWTARRCTSTPPPGSPTGANSAWAAKWGFLPRSSTPEAPWVCGS